jgi:NADH-quinone oxidoreductase subunit N
VNLQTLITGHLTDTQQSISLFLPELIVCATILIILLARVFNVGSLLTGFRLALIGSIVALTVALMQSTGYLSPEVGEREIFSGFLVYDSFTIYFRCFLMLFVVLFCILTRITGIPDREDGPDIYSLILGATLGMALMVSANHLLMVFLAVEMASVPSYVLAGLFKGRRKSSEAALKYSVYGAGAAGVMLYGISLLAGMLGTAHMPTMAAKLIEMDIPSLLASGTGASEIRVLALGGLMVMVGLAFKLSAVPFHFWCPDVFEGAPAEVNAFLSVASKAAALALLVRVAFGLGYVVAEAPVATAQVASPAAVAQQTEANAQVKLTAFVDEEDPAPGEEPVAQSDEAALEAEENIYSPQLAPVRSFMIQLLALMAAVTCTFGNLAAYGQTNIKRMLAYSTIAHAGYMMMPVVAALILVGKNPAGAEAAISSLALYAAVYLFMNLGAFAIVAFLRNAMHSEEIADYAGLIRSCPVTTICFVLILVSLIGLPPLAGFAGKYTIFLALVAADSPIAWALLVVAGLNTAISLVFYLRVVKVMTIDGEPDSRGPVEIGFAPGIYASLMGAFVLGLGLFWEQLYRWTVVASSNLFT